MSSVIGPIPIGSGGKIPLFSANVYTSSQWGSGWTLHPYLHPTSWSLVAAPEISRATFRYEYGRVSREDVKTKLDYPPLDIGNKFIRIQISSIYGADEIWQGYVPDTSLSLFGDGVGATGSQDITAYGIEWLLNQERIRTAWVQVDRRIDTVVNEVDFAPPYNQAIQRGVTSTVLGNRAIAPVTIGGRSIYPFYYSNVTPSVPWDGKVAVENLIATYAYVDDIGVDFKLVGQTSLLELFEIFVRLEGRTVWEAMNEIMAQKRGLTFSVRPSWPADPEIVVSSTAKDDVVINGVTYPGNPEVWNVDFGSALDMDQTTLILSTQDRYKEAIVTGDRLLSVFTGRVCAHGGTDPFVAGWETAVATEYAGITGTGLTKWEKRINADEQRARQERKFGRYLKYFALNVANWDGRDIFGQSVFPAPNSDGTVDFDTVVWPTNATRGFERYLPFKASDGFDDESAMDDLRKPFGLVEKDGKYRFIHDVKTPSVPNFAMRFADDEYAVELPNAFHWFGLNHFDPGPWKTQEKTMVPPEYDYTDLRFTVALRTDQRLRVVVTISGQANDRPLYLQVPEAQFWVIATNTMIDVDSAGNPAYTTGTIRDDSDQLWEAAAFAQSFYSTRRSLARYRVRGLYEHIPIGSMLGVGYTGGYWASINTVVTKKVYNFSSSEEANFIVNTGFWNIDVVGITGSMSRGRSGRGTGSTGVPDLPSQSVMIREIRDQGNEIKRIHEKTRNLPVRFGGESGGDMNLHVHDGDDNLPLVVTRTVMEDEDGDNTKPMGFYYDTELELWCIVRGLWG